jgi:hypothetical protein
VLRKVFSQTYRQKMNSTSKFKKILAAFYTIWFFIHLGLLVYAEDSLDSQQFWPFIKTGQTLQDTYDVFEFLIYVGIPLVLYIALKLLFEQREEEEYNTKKHSSSGTFFLAFLHEKIKSEELTQKINELKNQPVNHERLEELKKDFKKASSHGIDGWLERVEVRKKYKNSVK